MGLPGPIMLAPGHKTLHMILKLAFAASVLQLGSGRPTFIDAVDGVVGRSQPPEIIMNITTYPLISDQQIAVETKCSFLERVAEKTRRRRTTQFQPNADLAAIKTLAPYSYLSTGALSGVGMSFLAGLSTTIGAGVVFLLPGSQASATQMSFVLALAAGVMLSVTVFEFWLPALASNSISTGISALFFSVLGAVSFLLLSKFVPEPAFIEADVETQGGSKDDNTGQSTTAALSHRNLAKVLLLSLTAHNFPEGFAVAISSLSNDGVGFTVMLAIAMHNIPEGVAIAVPVLAATGSRRKALWWTFLSGMAEPAGALLALLLADATGIVPCVGVENLLCVVGGIMFTVATKELLPGAWNYGKPLSFITGLLLGVFLMIATIVLGA